jgi:hypothetical protein
VKRESRDNEESPRVNILKLFFDVTDAVDE